MSVPPSSSEPRDAATVHLFAGPGEMRARCRDLDWSTTALGPIDRWSASLRTAAQLVLAQPFPSVVLWGPDLVQIYNDGYRALMGARHPAGLGQPTRACWPEVWHLDQPIYERVWSGESVALEDALFPVTRSGVLEDAWLTLGYSPVRDEAGRVAGVLVTVFETTEQRRAEAARRESDARAQAIIANLPGGAVFVVDHDLRYQLAAGEAFTTIGFSASTFVGRTVHEVLDPTLAEAYTPHYRRALRGESFEVEHTSHGRTFLTRGAPLRQGDRGAVALAVSFDITERRQAEAALRASEEKYRTLLDSSDQGFHISELLYDEAGTPVDSRYLEVNRIFEQQTGLKGVVGRRVSETAPGAEASWFEAYGRVVQTGEPSRIEDYNRATDRWYSAYTSRVGGPDSSLFAVVFDDITDRKRHEQRQRFLLKLSDALRPLGDPEEIRLTAVQVLGQHLGANRVAYAENVGDGECFDVTRNYVDGAPEVVGRLRYADFGSTIVSDLQAGRTRVQPSIREDRRLSDAEKQALAGAGVGASLNVPLVKNGRFIAFLGVNYPQAHDFQADEIDLVRETAERTWSAVERARVEAALRESEDRLRTVLTGINESFYALDRDDRFLFVSRSALRVWGKNADEVLGRTFLEAFPQAASSDAHEAHRRVVQSGQAERLETISPVIGRWIEIDFAPTPQGGLSVAFRDIEARKQTERRQAFLLRFGDALRPLTDSAEMERTAMRVLGEELGVDRAFLATIEADGDSWSVRHDHARGLPSQAGHHPMSAFQRGRMESWQAGRLSSVADSEADPALSAADRAAYAASGTRAAIGVPLIKGDRLAALLSVNQSRPRTWTEAELALTHEAAERTWAAVERARAEEALRQSEAQYHTLFESIDEGFCLIERVQTAPGEPPDFRYLETNPAFARHAGLTGVVGRTIGEVVPGVETEVLAHYDRVATTGEPVRFESRIAALGIWLEIHASRVGAPEHGRLAVVFTNINERKRAEEVLREREERQTFLLTLSDTLRAETGAEAVGRRAVRMIAERLGLDRVYLVALNPDEDRDVTVTQEFRREDLPPLLGSYRSADFPSAIKEIFERTIVYDDVRTHPGLTELDRQSFVGLSAVGFAAVPIRRGSEAMIWAAGAVSTRPRAWTATEISLLEHAVERTWAAVERAHAEAALRDSERRFRTLVDNVRDYAIFGLDPGGFVTEWTNGAERVKGYTAAEVLGRHVTLFSTPEDVASGQVEHELSEAAATGRAEREGWCVRKDGTRIWVNEIITTVRSEDGTLRGFTKIGRDLTAHKLVEDERARVLASEQEARREAERAMGMRDEFLTVISHELRTPLSAILLWSQMLRSGVVPPDQRPKALASIEASATAQRKLIEDLLEVSRMLSGKVTLTLHEVALGPVLEDAIMAAQPMATARRVTVTSDLGDRSIRACVDPDRLQQVVWNLVTNAVKFTSAGGHVTVRLVADEQVVRITVEDTGRGIAPDFLPYVFERFRQQDASITRVHGGLGLGLAIARQLVELHGGTIAVTSAGEDQGATFTVELPRPEDDLFEDELASEEDDATAPPSFRPSAVLAGTRVLLVEDENETRTVLQWLLEQCEAHVTTAASADEALAAFDAGDGGAVRRFDVLVSDIGLPGRDGCSLLAALRQRPAGAALPALALTAYARPEDRQRVLAAGFNAYLAKPADPGPLVEAVAALAQGLPPASEKQGSGQAR